VKICAQCKHYGEPVIRHRVIVQSVCRHPKNMRQCNITGAVSPVKSPYHYNFEGLCPWHEQKAAPLSVAPFRAMLVLGALVIAGVIALAIATY
jgi:hypothetical protein